jgi:hypothetical protein
MRPSGIRSLKRWAIVLFKSVYIFLKVAAAAAAQQHHALMDGVWHSYIMTVDPPV